MMMPSCPGLEDCTRLTADVTRVGYYYLLRIAFYYGGPS